MLRRFVSLLSLFVGSLYVSVATAVVPAEVETTFDAFLTDAATISGYVITVVLGLIAIFVGIKLIKRFGSKVV